MKNNRVGPRVADLQTTPDELQLLVIDLHATKVSPGPGENGCFGKWTQRHYIQPRTFHTPTLPHLNWKPK